MQNKRESPSFAALSRSPEIVDLVRRNLLRRANLLLFPANRDGGGASYHVSPFSPAASRMITSPKLSPGPRIAASLSTAAVVEINHPLSFRVRLTLESHGAKRQGLGYGSNAAWLMAMRVIASIPRAGPLRRAAEAHDGDRTARAPA
jgi:hypothetical protein